VAQSNLFPKDALNTNITAPVANVSVQGPLNTSLTTQTRNAGVASFTQSLSSLAVKKQKVQIHNDIVLANLAAAYEKEMPGNLEPEAQFEYNRAADKVEIAKSLAHMEDYSRLEGAAFLEDDTVPREQRALNFKNEATALLNTSKKLVDPANAAELFPQLESAFHKIVGESNTELALQKKQEVLSTNAASIAVDVAAQFNLVESLAPNVSDKNPDGSSLTAEQFVFKQRTFAADWLNKGVNQKFFKGIISRILATKGLSDDPNANSADIKATALAIIGDEIIKRASSNPALANPEIISSLLNSIKGSTPKSTLATEIASRSTDGKILETIVNNFNTKLGRTITANTAQGVAASKARDNTIANLIIDNFGTYTEEQANQIATGINDAAKQISITNNIKAHYKAGPKVGIGTPAFRSTMTQAALIVKGANGVMTEEAKQAIYATGAGNGLTTAAIKEVVESADPQTAIGKQRTAIKGSGTISLFKSRFKSTITDLLKENNLQAIAAQLGEDIDLNDPLIRAGLISKLGSGNIKDRTMAILQKNLEFVSYIDDLARAFPKEELSVLEAKATVRFDSIMRDLLGATTKEPKEAVGGKDKGGAEGKGTDGGTGDPSKGGKKTLTFKERSDTVKSMLDTDPESTTKYVKAVQEELDTAEDLRKQASIASGVTPTTTGERLKAIMKFGGNNPKEIISNRTKLLQDNPGAMAILDARKDFVKEDKSKELARFGSAVITANDAKAAWSWFTDAFEGIRVFDKARKIQGDPEKGTPEAESPEELPVGKGSAAKLKDLPIPEGSHRVQQGETLSAIAATFDTTVDEIVKLNNIKDPEKIQAGAMLKVKELSPLGGGPIPAGRKSKKIDGGAAGRITAPIINPTGSGFSDEVKKANILKATGADKLGKNIESMDDIDGKTSDFAKEIFDAKGAIESLWHGSKDITSLARTSENTTGKILNNSSHNHGTAVDLRAFWTGSRPNDATSEDAGKREAGKTIMTAANTKLLTDIFEPILKSNGWEVVSPPKGEGDTVRIINPKGKHKDKVLKTQFWMKFKKDGEVRYIEVVSDPRHIHLHTGEDFAGGWES